MARFVSGDVVVLPYPFTDLTSSKVRPALVLAALDRGDIILCQITSQPGSHSRAVSIQMTDFEAGGGPATRELRTSAPRGDCSRVDCAAAGRQAASAETQ